MKRGTLNLFILIMLNLFTSVVLLPGCSVNSKTTLTSNNSIVTQEVYKRPDIVTSEQARQLLIDGNKRFVDNKTLTQDISNAKRKALSTNGQKPFAVILSCSDSRVPPELVFDQGLGDLFIIRNAGNVIDPIALGSIEYGVEHLKAPLIVVLGHEKCGAVEAVIEGGDFSPNITAIIKKIKPSYEKVKATSQDANEIYSKTIDENIRNSIYLINKSTVIKKLYTEKKVTVLGGKYHIDTGEVTLDIK